MPNLARSYLLVLILVPQQIPFSKNKNAKATGVFTGGVLVGRQRSVLIEAILLLCVEAC